MTDGAKPTAPSRALTNADDVRTAWDAFRAGGVVDCPSDGAPLALAVDASAGAYRFVCTRCGTASCWFESGPQGLRLRASLPVHGPDE